jgi:hypothetical protein
MDIHWCFMITYDYSSAHLISLASVVSDSSFHAGPHQVPLLTDPPTTVNHEYSTSIPPLSAPAPAEAGGDMPEPPPSSSVQGGSFTLPRMSPADGPAGSVSEAPPLTSKPRQILSGFILCLFLHFHMWIAPCQDSLWFMLCLYVLTINW